MLPASVVAKLAEARVKRSDATTTASPSLDPEVDRRITDWCADDVAALATLLGRALSAWR